MVTFTTSMKVFHAVRNISTSPLHVIVWKSLLFVKISIVSTLIHANGKEGREWSIIVLKLYSLVIFNF